MANKTLLVAKREYLENVRTKTFWISIFIVPVLIAASIGVGALLRQFKEVQRYAVVDLSGEGLSDRAEREFRSGDFGAILRAIQKQSKDGSLQEELTALAERVGAVEAPEDITADQQLALLNWIHDQPAEVRSMIEGSARADASSTSTRTSSASRRPRPRRCCAS